MYPLKGPLVDLRYQEVWRWNLCEDTSYMWDRDQVRVLWVGMAQLGEEVHNIQMMFGCFFEVKGAPGEDQAELQYILKPAMVAPTTTSAPPATTSSGIHHREQTS